MVCTLPASKITPGTCTWRQTSCHFILTLYYPNQHFPPAWYGLFHLNVAQEKWPGAMARYRRLRQGLKSFRSGFFWIFFGANARQTSTVPFRKVEKKNGRSKQCWAKKVPQKSTESNASCMIKRPGCPEPRARAIIMQPVVLLQTPENKEDNSYNVSPKGFVR